MTCIIGLVHKGTVYIGGDSALVAGWSVSRVAHPKVFVVQDFLIGCTGSIRMRQILEHHLVVPPQKDQTDLKYLVTEFIPAVRGVFKEHWFDNINDEDNSGGTFLMAYRGHLYCIYGDFQITEQAGDFNACGAGEDFAYGAMAALVTLAPEERIRRALEIAARFCGAVCEPFHILSQGDSKETPSI